MRQPGFMFGQLAAHGDMSGNQYKGVIITSNGIELAGAGYCVGILQNKPLSGQSASVMLDGISEGIAGGNITVGAFVTTDANGKFIVAAAGANIVGQALSAGANGELVYILLKPKGDLVV